MGEITNALLSDLRKQGVASPGTTLELLAVRLASLLDSAEVDEKHAAGIARELRLTIAAVFASSAPAKDVIDAIQARADSKDS